MKDVFDLYAGYYDLLYKDKDYGAESDYAAKLIKEYAPNAETILELGCGTAAHAEHLAKMGFTIHGVNGQNK
ncbi:MAG: class I SAM-dependent methyltransferase [Desulfamplus sp.]|nr:class I SAM-dependent methyltransferase [Desulfamplus sp.]